MRKIRESPGCPEKRSQALREHHLRRDIRVANADARQTVAEMQTEAESTDPQLREPCRVIEMDDCRSAC